MFKNLETETIQKCVLKYQKYKYHQN